MGNVLGNEGEPKKINFFSLFDSLGDVFLIAAPLNGVGLASEREREGDFSYEIWAQADARERGGGAKCDRVWV